MGLRTARSMRRRAAPRARPYIYSIGNGCGLQPLGERSCDERHCGADAVGAGAGDAGGVGLADGVAGGVLAAGAALARGFAPPRGAGEGRGEPPGPGWLVGNCMRTEPTALKSCV